FQTEPLVLAFQILEVTLHSIPVGTGHTEAPLDIGSRTMLGRVLDAVVDLQAPPEVHEGANVVVSVGEFPCQSRHPPVNERAVNTLGALPCKDNRLVHYSLCSIDIEHDVGLNNL